MLYQSWWLIHLSYPKGLIYIIHSLYTVLYILYSTSIYTYCIIYDLKEQTHKGPNVYSSSSLNYLQRTNQLCHIHSNLCSDTPVCIFQYFLTHKELAMSERWIYQLCELVYCPHLRRILKKNYCM